MIRRKNDTESKPPENSTENKTPSTKDQPDTKDIPDSSPQINGTPTFSGLSGNTPSEFYRQTPTLQIN